MVQGLGALVCQGCQGRWRQGVLEPLGEGPRRETPFDQIPSLIPLQLLTLAVSGLLGVPEALGAHRAKGRSSEPQKGGARQYQRVPTAKNAVPINPERTWALATGDQVVWCSQGDFTSQHSSK